MSELRVADLQELKRATVLLYTKGDAVTDPYFGTGVVLDVVSEVEKGRVLVNFAHHGKKWIALAFGRLHKDGPASNSVSEAITHPSSNIAPAISPALCLPAPIETSASSADVKVGNAISRRGAIRFLARFLVATPIVTTLHSQANKATQGRELIVLETTIAGFAHYRGKHCAAHIRRGDHLRLSREPENRHDGKAIEVYWQEHKIGYVPKRNNVALSR